MFGTGKWTALTFRHRESSV